MKFILIISAILIFLSSFLFSQYSPDNGDYSRFGVSLKAGRKFFLENVHPTFDAANYYGIGLKLNFGKYVSVQPEITFWSAVQHWIPERYGNSQERMLMICLQNVTNPYNIKFYFGIGGFKYTYGNERLEETASSLNVGAGYGYCIYKKIEIVGSVRYQRAGRFSISGGSLYESYILGLSTDFDF